MATLGEAVLEEEVTPLLHLTWPSELLFVKAELASAAVLRVAAQTVTRHGGRWRERGWM